MIKSIKQNLIRENLLFGLFILCAILLYNIFLIIYRAEASKIDNETSKVETNINNKEIELKAINETIEKVKKTHQDYLTRIEHQKNLTIDLKALNGEITNLVDMLNKYYNNAIFKIRLSNVSQNEDYINLAEINLYFEFFHQLQHSPEVALELEKTVIKNVYNDITNNFSKLINIEKRLSSANYDLKTISLFYVKDK